MGKKLVGGEYLLDLTPITIAESVDGETYTNITNEAVIEQLTNLKEYIRNPKAIKPVWVKFVNDEDDAVIVTRGSLSIVDDGEFDIDIAIDGYKLKIHIEFTQATLSDSTPIDDWYIDTNDAKYLFTSDAQNISPIAEDVAKDVIESAESGTIANILGLDSEGGLVKEARDSAVKPIYYHPIYITDETSGSQKRLSFVILDNQSTPYDFSGFKTKIKELMDNGALIQCNGYFDKSGTTYNAYIVLKTSTSYYMYGNDYQGNREPTDIDTIVASSFSDGVNKIN